MTLFGANFVFVLFYFLNFDILLKVESGRKLGESWLECLDTLMEFHNGTFKVDLEVGFRFRGVKTLNNLLL